MENQDIRTLQLLEEMEKDAPTSQRDLARRLNVSLGLVNSFIKRLANKGYFKVTTIPKNRARYILTPTGAAEKTRLTYEYIQYSYRFYRNARKEFNRLFGRLKNQRVEKVVFYGTGDLAEIAYISLQQTAIRLVAVVDADRAGEWFLGYEVKQPSELGDLAFDRVLVTIPPKQAAALEENLSQVAQPEKVVWLQAGSEGVPG